MPSHHSVPALAARGVLAVLLAATAACSSSSGGAAVPGAPRAVGPAPEQSARYPAQFQVLGRGAVTHVRNTDLWAFRGANGRDYVYTGTVGICEGCIGARMFVWDVTDPANPVITDSVLVDAGAIGDVAVNREGTLAAVGRRGAGTRRNGVVFLNLADPAHPKPAGEYWETLTGGVQSLWWDGDLLYAADAGAGDLAVLDVSNPRDARVIGRWGVPVGAERFLSDVHVKDGLAYLAYWDDGLIVLDVGNGIKGGTPNRPRPVAQARYRTEWRNQRYGNTSFAFPYTNAAGKKYVFVADAITQPGAEFTRRVDIGGLMHVFDATNIEQPIEVATYEVPDRGINRFWVARDTLFVATNNGGLRALNVAGELRGRIRDREVAVLATGDERSHVPGLTFTWAAMPHNGLVFATDLHSGLWVTRLVPSAQ